MATQTGAYKRLLGLLQAQRQDAVSEAGFALGKKAVEEEQDVKEIQSNIDKEVRRLEKAQRKRARKKGMGGLLGSALGFALAGPLGLSASLATGLGSLAGSRLAGQKKIRGLDPNLTLRENAEFYKQAGEDLGTLVDDISSQLDESYKDELVSDVFTAIGSGATGGQLGKTNFGKNLSSFFGDDVFRGKSLNLGEKISGIGQRVGQRFGNLFGGEGFVTDNYAGPLNSETALRNIMPDITGSLQEGTLGMSFNPTADQALANRFAVQGPSTDAFMSQGVPTSNYIDAIKNINRSYAAGLASRDKLMSLMIDASGGLPNVDSLISAQTSALPRPGFPISSMNAPMADLKNYFLQSFPAGASDFPFVGSPEDDMASDLLVEQIPNEFNMRQPVLSRLLQLYGYPK